MPSRSPQIDCVFQALADPTRRAVVERLSGGPASTSDLAQPFKMALPFFSQHLHMLEKCGLVRSHKRGRVRTYRIAAERMREAEHWMTRQRAIWERRLDQLDGYLTDLEERNR